MIEALLEALARFRRLLMSWAPPPLSVQVANAKLAHDVLIVGWPDAPGGSIPAFDEIAAAGILAQFQAESAFDEKAVGDHGNAIGLAQWWTSRRSVIAIGCQIDLASLPDVTTQTRAAMWELWHPERPALLQILAAATPYDAGVAACVHWMRPKQPDNRVARGNMAAALYARFNPT